MLSLSYSFTVSHPPGDLSAIRKSLLQFLMCSIHSWSFFDGLFLDPSSIRFSTSSSVSFNSSLNRYCFSLDLYLKSLSLFLFDEPPPLLLMNFFSNPDNFLSKYFFISLIEFLSAILTTAPPCTINYRLVI